MTTKKEIIESLKIQREIFGDLLYSRIDIPESFPEEEKILEPPVKKPEGYISKPAPEIKEAGMTYDLNLGKFVEKTEKKPAIENNTTPVKPAIPPIDAAWQKTNDMDSLRLAIQDCQLCRLGATRNKFVFGTGSHTTDIMVIGEGPGADEDRLGEPFVGRAGQLLNDILAAIKFPRESVYIANIVKCRPPANRNPLPDEVSTCIPFLHKQIEIIKPKVILCLGLVAANSLLNDNTNLTKMRGKVFEFGSAKVMVTYHPAALLRNPNWKKFTWEDVQAFRKLYDNIMGS
ncbi:MAG: uracil-DNA glycosylase [Ignavibacteriales bacterium]|nr:uracil-DNA glycosylase [Ignavibacteriales bacterium]MCF8315614.1 uracil-DNA glycosylase [Ignavibacteriales bacterium]MCF8437192.1 uracil-DNA glycosylase [Ignavibacteriales bacterium]